MMRTTGFLIAVASVAALGCDNGKAKVEAAAKKVDQAVDKLEADEAAGHLAAAKAALAQGTDPAEACTYAMKHREATELNRLCTFDVPMRHATVAVTSAEKARAEQPEAPTLTECQSDEWGIAKRILDGAYGNDAAWVILQGRWTKVCPGM